MDYPHGHVGRHSHHNNRDDDEDNYPPPPPPPFSHMNPPYQNFPPPPQHSYDGGYNQPPPPHHQNYPPQQESYGGDYNQPPQHESYGGDYNQPPQQESYGGAYNQPPPPQQESYGGPPTHHHSFKPHMPSFAGSHSHSHHGPDESEYGGGPGPDAYNYGGGPGPELGLGHLENKPTHKIHCKAGGDRFVFGIRDVQVVLTHPDSSDLTQHWYKDEKYSIKVKDKEGHPSFILVNKGTRQAVKHSVSCHPVQLATYKPDVLDESVLWTESKDLGSGYRSVRTVNNVRLVMDAWNADKDHGGIHDGTVIALYETWKGDNQNQQWKFERH